MLFINAFRNCFSRPQLQEGEPDLDPYADREPIQGEEGLADFPPQVLEQGLPEIEGFVQRLEHHQHKIRQVKKICQRTKQISSLALVVLTGLSSMISKFGPIHFDRYDFPSLLIPGIPIFSSGAIGIILGAEQASLPRTQLTRQALKAGTIGAIGTMVLNRALTSIYYSPSFPTPPLGMMFALGGAIGSAASFVANFAIRSEYDHYDPEHPLFRFLDRD